MAGPLDRPTTDGAATTTTKKAGGGLDPITIALTGAGAFGNMLTGGAQARAAQKQFDAERQDRQRESAQQQAQFAAEMAFNRDKDRFARAKDVYGMQREQESDAYRRAQTNATNPMRRDLMTALMARLTGGQGAMPMQGAAIRPGSYQVGQVPQQPGVPGQPPVAPPPRLNQPGLPQAMPVQFQQTFNPAQLSGQPAITQRPDYAALEQAAAREYERIENPANREVAPAMDQLEQEARKRAEGSIQNKVRQFALGERDKDEYERRVGFDIDDPANRDKWIELFMADDAEYQNKRNQANDTFTRTVGVERY